MQITRLRLTGFKSFVDPADLHIEPGLTGIVGPNGCGKSNLLEALRWAMGESSARSLRGAGMDDVIFAGTATRPQRDFAEVVIHAEQVAGDDTVEVVRRIERGAGSAYRINGRDVRARDVALLFADAATGAHSPALVSQNRIGAVIAAKPVERRAMLEEAAGIAGLHVRRKEAETRLRATEANLQRLDDLIADQDARVAALRRQAKQAERYRELSGRIRTAEGRMIFARWREAAMAADAAGREAEQAEAAVGAAGHAAHVAEAEASAAREALATARAAALTARDALADARRRLDALAGERRGIERRLGELATAARRFDEDRARESDLARDAADAIARLNAEARTLDTRIAAAASQLPEREAALATAERQARDAEVALAQGLAAQAAEAAEVRVAQAAQTAARQQLDRAERDLARIAAEGSALADETPLTAARAAAEQRRDAARRLVEDARAALAAADADERAAIDRRQHAVAARATAHADLAALDAEAAALTRSTRRPDGGARLLDMVRPKPGYERALAAAIGDDLEAGTDPEADRFWAGGRLQPDDPAPPAGLSSLVAHVVAPAVLARRLAQTVVAGEDDGQPLAVGQRLVTLAGMLRRWDGYVVRSGGAAAAERLERLNRLRAIEAARPAATAALDTATAAVAAVEVALADARRAAQVARGAIEANERTGRDAARDADRAAAVIERLEGQRADLAARHARAAADRAEAEGALGRADAALAALPDGAETQARVAALSADAERHRAAVAAAHGERTALTQALAQDRARVAAATAEAKGWRARAGEAARRIAEIDRRAAETAAEHDRLADRPAALIAAQGEADRAVRTLERAADEAAEAERMADAALREREQASRLAAETLATAREARAGAAARAENEALRRVEMGRLSGERFECPPPLLPERAGFDAADILSPAEESARHERLTAERERIGPVNLIAARELAELDAERAGNARERDELGEAVHRLRGSIGTLNREGRQRLLAAFQAVDGHFRRLFTTLFDGGQAHLALVDSDDPLEAGLEIMAQPPGKKLQSLTLLSGGEQALTAVALIFGLFLTNPAPICVLDEVDAPLDDANIDRFCDLLDRMTQETRTRYLIVTHNAATMSRMHRLFGVTMVERGVSRLVSVDLGGAEHLLAAE